MPLQSQSVSEYKMQILAAVSVLGLLLSPSFAYFDGAGLESCYNHSIEHTADLGGGVFLPSTSTDCSPCTYELWVLWEHDGNGNRIRNISTTGRFSYSLGLSYEFELRATADGFLGFLIQARDDSNTTVFDPNSDIVGTWDSGPLYHTLNCSRNSSSVGPNYPNSVTQSNSEMFRGASAPRTVRFIWTPLTVDDDDIPKNDEIVFWFTIVRQLLSHFFPVSGPVGVLTNRPTPPPPPPTTPTTPISATPTSATMTSTKTSGLTQMEIIIIAVVVCVGGVLPSPSS